MKELAAILSAQARQPEQTAALATLVQASGSTYRRPGARLWISAGGESVGSISGGCLEQDVIEKAQGVMQNGQPLLLAYDTTSEEDLVFGAGLGCKGAVHILVEPVRPGLLLAGRYAVCTGAISADPMGYDPLSAHGTYPFPGDNHLLLLAQVGVGAIDPKRIEVRGLPLAKALFPFNPKRIPLEEPAAYYGHRSTARRIA